MRYSAVKEGKMSVLIVSDNVINSIVTRIMDSQEVSNPLTYMVKDLLEHAKKDSPEWNCPAQWLSESIYGLNVHSYNQRYREPLEFAHFTYRVTPLCFDMQLVKYLDCWCYQIEGDYLENEYYKLLDKLRLNLMAYIVRNLQTYLDCKWCD